MLIKSTGNCENCGSAFGERDTIQSVQVECKKCITNKNLCEKCKKKVVFAVVII